MKNKNSDLWLSIYTFLLLPFWVLINLYKLFNSIKDFNKYDNLVITIILLIIILISIGYYAYTFMIAKDYLKKAYNYIIGSIILGVLSSSFNQTVDLYLNQGVKFYLMFIVYLILFTCCWAAPNYVYFERRKNLFKLDKKLNNNELVNKIKLEIKEKIKNKKVSVDENKKEPKKVEKNNKKLNQNIKNNRQKKK